VLETTNGAVPVDTVEVICPDAEMVVAEIPAKVVEAVKVFAAVNVLGDPDKTLPPPVPATVAVNGPDGVIPVPETVYL
jgi:hypothetical protein